MSSKGNWIHVHTYVQHPRIRTYVCVQDMYGCDEGFHMSVYCLPLVKDMQYVCGFVVTLLDTGEIRI